jgi:hypothetical protein
MASIMNFIEKTTFRLSKRRMVPSFGIATANFIVTTVFLLSKRQMAPSIGMSMANVIEKPPWGAPKELTRRALEAFRLSSGQMETRLGGLTAIVIVTEDFRLSSGQMVATKNGISTEFDITQIDKLIGIGIKNELNLIKTQFLFLTIIC